MLGIWRPHAEYQTYLLKKLKQLLKNYSKPIQEFSATILKMWQLDLDPMKPIIAPLFSTTGRPSNQQPEIMRLLVLMSDQREHDIDKWLKVVAITPLFCALVGLDASDLPGASTVRDYISRLWQGEKPDPLQPPTCRPKMRYGKEKQPPKRPGIIAHLCREAKTGETFHDTPESVLQAVFLHVALTPSALLGLLGNTHKLKVSADGTCVESHARPFGHKNCLCVESCNCHRRFADPLATWGWDSYHERFFYGYSLYALSIHNASLRLDLPIYLRFADASQFDGVSLIESFAHSRNLYQNLLRFDAVIADSAHDNHPTYDLMRHFKVRPFIDLNRRKNGETPKPQNIPLSKNGTPVCAAGHEMVYWGFDKTKFRTKYRAPCVVGHVSGCPLTEQCCPTPYGKIIYLRHTDNLRFYPPVPRDSDKWKAIYDERTAAERVNNRILTDYKLEQPKRRGKKCLSFFAFINAINIHLDARVRCGYLDLNALIA